MKKLFLLVILFPFLLPAQQLPVRGKTYNVTYNTAEKNILTNSKQISVVYAFDFWSSGGQFQMTPEDLFMNVLHPDSGRAHKEMMEKKGEEWTGEINISDTAQILSYYFTDGKNYDYNDKKTYVSYIYNADGKPVEGARFRNIDFLKMASAPAEKQADEIKAELDDYPDYFIAYVPYWKTKFEAASSADEIINMGKEIDSQFSALEKMYPGNTDLLAAEAKVYYVQMNDVFSKLRGFQENNMEKIMKLCESIPREHRGNLLNNFYDSMMRERNSGKFSKGIVGKAAPDFSYTSVRGKKGKLSSLRGKYVLLDFWGTWCGPCVGEIPNMIKAYNEFKDKGFEIVSVSSDAILNGKDGNYLKDYADMHNMKWTQVLDEKKNSLIQMYSVSHFPTLFLIDKNGVVIKNEAVLRGKQLEDTLSELMK